MANLKGITLEKVFGKHGNGKLIGKGGVAISPATGDIAVADCNAHDVKVFNSSGVFKFSLDLHIHIPCWTDDGKIPDPWGVAATAEGQYLVADHGSRIKVFDSEGRFQDSFRAIPPNRSKKLSRNALLVFVTIEFENQIIVGSASSPHFVSIHSAPRDGFHVRSFNVGFEPVFITPTLHGHLVISKWVSGKIQILNHNGGVVRNVVKPADVAVWQPTGMACFGDSVLIANLGDDDTEGGATGIYQYDLLSDTLTRCHTGKDIKDPWGVALDVEHQKLVVVDDKAVKIFKLDILTV